MKGEQITIFKEHKGMTIGTDCEFHLCEAGVCVPAYEYISDKGIRSCADDCENWIHDPECNCTDPDCENFEYVVDCDDCDEAEYETDEDGVVHRVCEPCDCGYNESEHNSDCRCYDPDCENLIRNCDDCWERNDNKELEGIGLDGCESTGELRPEYSKTPQGLIDNLSGVLERLSEILKDNYLKMYGNIITPENRPAGFHIHIGGVRIPNYAEKEICKTLRIVGFAWNNNKENHKREERYGKWDDVRENEEYGTIEFRQFPSRLWDENYCRFIITATWNAVIWHLDNDKWSWIEHYDEKNWSEIPTSSAIRQACEICGVSKRSFKPKIWDCLEGLVYDPFHPTIHVFKDNNYRRRLLIRALDRNFDVKIRGVYPTTKPSYWVSKSKWLFINENCCCVSEEVENIMTIIRKEEKGDKICVES